MEGSVQIVEVVTDRRKHQEYGGAVREKSGVKWKGSKTDDRKGGRVQNNVPMRGCCGVQRAAKVTGREKDNRTDHAERATERKLHKWLSPVPQLQYVGKPWNCFSSPSNLKTIRILIKSEILKRLLTNRVFYIFNRKIQKQA